MLFLKGVHSSAPLGKHLAVAPKTLIFLKASNLLGSRYLLFPFWFWAGRLVVGVKYLVQGHTTGN